MTIYILQKWNSIKKVAADQAKLALSNVGEDHAASSKLGQILLIKNRL